jgi:DNA-binding PadR family transcriptional regulator
MDVFHDYAFVVSGKKRKEVVKLLIDPRTPTELAKLLKVHANVITRILRDLASRQLVESHELKGKKKTYRLTKRGELARQLLNNLIEPKTRPEMVKLLKTHRAVLTSIIKNLVQNGFVTLFKSIKPARKFYQLTKKGEDVREKLE